MAMKSNNTESSFVQDGEQVKSTVKRSNIFNEFFWICSGANRHILRQCPTEYSKYFGIGGTIFFTAAMAMLSGGYAFYTIFNSTLWAVLFGVFWGLLIFNLDRFIVNTMYSDGKYTISLGELAAGTPRLVIAIFLGIVISTPLEMKIFEDRIESQIIKDNARRTEETRAVAQSDDDKQREVKEEYDKLNAERKVLADALNVANKELKDEGEGAALSGKAGHGPIYKEKKEYADKCQKALDDWDAQNGLRCKSLQNQLNHFDILNKQFDEDIAKRLENKGFCVRYEAFSNIKEEVHALRIVSIFIMLLFIIIEVTPTFFKMMIASGPYDELLNEEMHRKKVRAIQSVSNMNDEVNTQLQISTEKIETS